MAFNERTLMVMGEDAYNRIVKKHIVLVGVGGVGGAVFECLVRFGIEKITIIDFDTVDRTNLNRQIISTTDTVGKIKVDVAKARGLAINPDCEINTYNMFVEKDNLHIIKELSPDYVIDAIDSVKSKLDLVQFCHENDINIISAMGTGNRFAVDGFVIDTVENTAGNGCGLSRVMRQELRKRGVQGHISLYNRYPPQTKAVNSSNGRHAPGSTVFAPNIAGIMIAQYVCEQLGKEQ
ncbi:MAG: ThiF family adenylyltransferase [Oscillospiraceae bacterium]|nr:ThiF family adenylyltransferase [Oscillospiraceae bacterium]